MSLPWSVEYCAAEPTQAANHICWQADELAVARDLLADAEAERATLRARVAELEAGADRREDRAYVSGARQAQAMAHQSLAALDAWINGGCGNRTYASAGAG